MQPALEMQPVPAEAPELQRAGAVGVGHQNLGPGGEVLAVHLADQVGLFADEIDVQHRAPP